MARSSWHSQAVRHRAGVERDHRLFWNVPNSSRNNKPRVAYYSEVGPRRTSVTVLALKFPIRARPLRDEVKHGQRTSFETRKQLRASQSERTPLACTPSKKHPKTFSENDTAGPKGNHCRRRSCDSSGAGHWRLMGSDGRRREGSGRDQYSRGLRVTFTTHALRYLTGNDFARVP